MTREHPITKTVERDAWSWAKGMLTVAQFGRKHGVSGNTAYRMLAAALAKQLNKE